MNRQGPGGISWTNYTWNPVTGCERGCPYCYARRTYERFGRSFEPTLHEKRLVEPTKVKEPSKVFVCSVADLFGPWVPSAWVKRVLIAADEAPQHTYQYLTKCPEGLSEWAFNSNDWVGITAVDQASAEVALSYFASRPRTLIPVRFISAEPLIGPIDTDLTGLDWLIIGAMTGPGATAPKIEWVRRLVERAIEARVPVWMKENLAVTPRAQMWPGVYEESVWKATDTAASCPSLTRADVIRMLGGQA